VCSSDLFSPRVRYDFFWPRDPMPWFWQTIHACVDLFKSRWRKLIIKARRRRLVTEFDQKCQTREPDLGRVLFLCYGNICRSAFAEAIWNSSKRTVASARSGGFYPRTNRRTPARICLLAKRLGATLEHHRSKTVDRAAVDEASAIFVMDAQNIEDLLRTFPHVRSKSWLLGSFAEVKEIADPYLLPEIEATHSLQQIATGVKTLLDSKTVSKNAVTPPSDPSTLG